MKNHKEVISYTATAWHSRLNRYTIELLNFGDFLETRESLAYFWRLGAVFAEIRIDVI